jgi:serine/threonine protein kinase
MADYDLEYRTTEATAELMTRPHYQASHNINGQAGFLSLALHLKVPIISNLRNVEVHGNSSIAGVGASATVANHEDVFKANLDRDFTNHIEEDWFEMCGQRTVNLRYVTKKIRTNVGSTDAQHLASMVNEVRILASETLHQRHNVVRLFAISWLERSDQGRHWPQLLVQKADLGTLDSFVKSGPRNLQTKLMLSLDMLHGLDALHDHGVTHCDLKPQNVLIFIDDLRAARAELTTQSALDPVRAVLCDFGFSVIHSDYSPSASIEAGIGTYPWMAPEMETQAAVQLKDLHKADLYSFTLTMASLLMDGRRPFASLDRESVTRIKLGEDEDLTAAEQVEDELRRQSNLTPSDFTYISIILNDALAPRLEDRSDLQTLYNGLSDMFSLTVAHSGYYVPDGEAVAL